MRTRSMMVLAAAALAAAGCSSDDDESRDSAAPMTTTATTTATTVATTTAATDPATTEAVDTTDAETTEVPATTDDTDTDDTDTDVTEETTGTLVDADELEDRLDTIEQALDTGDFTLLLDALELSELSEEFEEEEVTLLAPTNDAFGELTGEQYADLLTNPTAIDDLLRRHMIDEVLTLDELAQRTEVTTVSGDTLEVTVEGDVVKVAGATVTEPERVDTEESAGSEVAVLAVDRVLVEDE